MDPLLNSNEVLQVPSNIVSVNELIRAVKNKTKLFRLLIYSNCLNAEETA